jgi:hypothetical protein
MSLPDNLGKQSSSLFAAIMVMASGLLVDLVSAATSSSYIPSQSSSVLKGIIRVKRLLLLIAMPVCAGVALSRGLTSSHPSDCRPCRGGLLAIDSVLATLDVSTGTFGQAYTGYAAILSHPSRYRHTITRASRSFPPP